MGVQGVKCTITKTEILEAIKAKKGVASHVIKLLSISNDTFYKLVDEYDLKEALAAARKDFEDVMCDAAENVLMIALHQKEELGHALGAARYVLNNKGRARGYYPPVAPPPSQENVIDDVQTGVREVSEERRSEIAGESEVAAESSVSNRRQKR